MPVSCFGFHSGLLALQRSYYSILILVLLLTVVLVVSSSHGSITTRVESSYSEAGAVFMAVLVLVATRRPGGGVAPATRSRPGSLRSTAGTTAVYPRVLLPLAQSASGSSFVKVPPAWPGCHTESPGLQSVLKRNILVCY